MQLPGQHRAGQPCAAVVWALLLSSHGSSLGGFDVVQ